MAGVVSEADAAFYSFGCVMLFLYIVPASLLLAFRLWKNPKQLRTRSVAIQLGVLAVAITLVWRCLVQLQSVDVSGVFDPYEILKITDSASIKQIKKAYRKLGRELHPDKNLHNPLAGAQFTRVTKAYEALTDPIGMANYAKYGHPDGPQSLFMDFAILSSFSGASGGSGSLFVLLYFVVIFGGIAWGVYKLTKNAGRRDRTQISKRTHALFVDALQPRMSVHDIVELLLSSDEMTAHTGEEDQIQAQQRAKAHDKMLKKMEAAKAMPAEVFSRIKKHPNHIAREYMIALYYFLRRTKLQGVSKPAWGEFAVVDMLCSSCSGGVLTGDSLYCSGHAIPQGHARVPVPGGGMSPECSTPLR